MTNVRDMSHPINESVDSDRGFFESELPPKAPPHEESYFGMMRNTLFPRLGLLSLCTIVVVVCSAVFVLQIFLDGIKLNGEFLEVKASGILVQAFGKMDGPIRNRFQYYRLFTALFLHGSFNHLFGNMLSVLLWGSLIEQKVGRLKTSIIYLLAGVIGNLFSMIFSKKNEVGLGASTAIFSFFGILISLVILNWQRFIALGIGFVLLINVLMLSRDANVDHYAHAGGFAAGITLGLTFADLEEAHSHPLTAYETRVKRVGLAATGIFFISCLLLYFIGL